jgi:riboflavin kinase
MRPPSIAAIFFYFLLLLSNQHALFVPRRTVRQNTRAFISCSTVSPAPVSSDGSALPNVLRVRGKVASGFGRGSRKLGFPTANLPSSLFGAALSDWPTGVYFGFARVEDDGGENVEGTMHDTDNPRASTGFGISHRAVVNIGFSPTFEDESNREKIVEAHLMRSERCDEGDGSTPIFFNGNFYGCTMTLVLIGYLREEMKFPSFPALVAQITQDAEDAAAALEREPFLSFPDSDSWLLSTNGNSGEWEKAPFFSGKQSDGGLSGS